MAYRVDLTPQANDDLDDILDFLERSYRHFGYSVHETINMLDRRDREIRQNARSIGRVPHQGTLRPEFGPGVRNVTKDRAIFYFTVDDEAQVVRVFSIFYGGQDHLVTMRKRLP